MSDLVRRWRVARYLSKTITRGKQLSKIESTKPRDDRRCFIVTCDAYGQITVTYYDRERDYDAAYDAIDEDSYVWCLGYNHWDDQR